jgi:hypothetical protein
MLKQEYKEGLSLEEAKALAIKILSKSLDTTKLSPEKCKCLPVIFMYCSSYVCFRKNLNTRFIQVEIHVLIRQNLCLLNYFSGNCNANSIWYSNPNECAEES